MNKIGWKYGLFGLLAWLFVSCQQEGLTDMGQGYLTVSLLEEATGEATKATPAQLEKEIEGLFHLTIRNASGYTVYDDAFTDGSIRVAAGTYTVTATYGNNQPLALDAPYYTGESAQIQVTAGSTQATEVTCRLANALISIDWTNQSKFDAIYSNYGVQVQVGTASAKMTPADGKSAYLQAGKAFTLQFVGTRISDQATVTIPLTSTELPTTLTAQEHCKLTLSPDTQTGLKIQKAVVSQTTISETIPLEWLPAAEIKAVGFENNLLSFYETETPAAQLEFKLASALQDMAFELDFGDYLDENQQSLNGAYKLSELTPEQKQQLVNAGFILPQIGAQGAAYFTFNSLLAKLKSSASGPVNYTIKLTSLKSNGRDACSSGEQVYTITLQQPVFTVAVDERNCWSREFTIEEVNVTHGNSDKIKAQLVYQYYDGSAWIDCMDRQGNMGRLQQFAAAAEDLSIKSYPVRALFRGEIASAGEVTATLENPDQLPNSDMEEWYYQSYDNHANIVTYFPWSSSSTSFWNTNNEFTTRYRQVTFAEPYNSFPAVSYVPTSQAHSGNRAAELRNTAAGFKNTVNSFRTVNKVAGILFTGDFYTKTGAVPNDEYTKTDGREWSSRPTALQFYAKYAPLEADTWKAEIEIWNENKEVIAKQSLESSEASSIYQLKTIPLSYSSETLHAKCKYIYVIFRSTITEGDDMKWEMKDSYTLWEGDTEKTYNDTSLNTHPIGSVLTIDDISLIYEK